MPRTSDFTYPSSSSSSVCSSSSSSSSDDDEDDFATATNTKRKSRRNKKRKKAKYTAVEKKSPISSMQQQGHQNIILKVLQRERTGYLSSRPGVRCNQQKLSAVPKGLSFCLKDIVPYCYLTGHVFMGLTVCGQFLLSYKVTVIDTNDFDQFSIGSYKYELYFWIYRPHQLLRKFYSRPLFDDHGADNDVTVTMCQWMDTPRTLIVHGSCKYENEDSYVSVVAVPRLGCLSCRRLRDTGIGAENRPFDATTRSAMLCIACNLTVHTKYTRSESDPLFEPRINLNCPERIILFTNGLIHMLNVCVDIHAVPPSRRTACLNVRYVRRKDDIEADDLRSSMMIRSPPDMPNSNLPNIASAMMSKSATLPEPVSQKPADIVAQIIADFDDFESASCSTASPAPSFSIENATTEAPVKVPMTTKFFEELVINTIPTSGAPRSVAELRRPTTNNNSLRWIARLSSLASPPKAESTNINNNNTTDTTATNNLTNASSATNAYDFADEPPERYEKISSFRKRRLADKKYEFSEDNSENIIPFAKLRMRRQNILLAGGDAMSPHSNALAAMRSPSPAPANYVSSDSTPAAVAAAAAAAASAQQTQPPHTHRASPSHGFRSPCGSPVGGNRFSIMSPPMSHRSAGVSAVPSTASPTSTGLTASIGGIVAGSTGLFGRSPTYKPFGSSPRYIKRFESISGELGTTIYSPMLLSPRSDIDIEAFRMNTASSLSLPSPQHQPSSNYGLPLAEVKPSNIFNHTNHNNTTTAANPLASAEPPTKDIAPSVPTTPTTIATAASPARTIPDEPSLASSSMQSTPLLCAKQLLRRYVAPSPPTDVGSTGDDHEEDDRCSVMTEDDDCISPGYHTSLPVEVHGACYATLQSVSAATLQQRRQTNAPYAKTAVLVAQHTFDLEMLTYHIANHLCVLHGKQYGSFYDWACEPIHICPLSAVLVSLLLVKFTARDATPPGAEPCLNCSNGDRLDCAFHRRHFEGRSLFMWNVQTGEWSVIDYGNLVEQSSSVPKRRSADATKSSVNCSSSAGAAGNSNTSGNGLTSGSGSSGCGSSDHTLDLTACARRLASEMRAAGVVPSALLGSSNRVRNRTNGTRRNTVDTDVCWTRARLHTLDSCTERSKEFLRDQYNAIEFVRGASHSNVSGGNRGSSGALLTDDGSPTMGAYDLSSSSDNSDWE